MREWGTNWRCRVLGHDIAFRSAGSTMSWQCSRSCGTTGSKEYASRAQAARYAVAFDRHDRDALGARAPLIGLFPLRVWRRLRSARGEGSSG